MLVDNKTYLTPYEAVQLCSIPMPPTPLPSPSLTDNFLWSLLNTDGDENHPTLPCSEECWLTIKLT